MKRYTLKVVDENLRSAWVKGSLAVQYTIGEVARELHCKLPLFALDPDKLPSEGWNLHPGCCYDKVLLVEYETKDVAGFTPWLSHRMATSVINLPVNKILADCVYDKVYNIDLGLRRLKVVRVVKPHRFPSAKAAVDYCTKKLSKKSAKRS